MVHAWYRDLLAPRPQRLDDRSTARAELEIGDAPAGAVDRRDSESAVADEQLFYLMSRGLSQGQALAMVVNGFFAPVTGALALEYEVEWSRLIELQMEDSVG